MQDGSEPTEYILHSIILKCCPRSFEHLLSIVLLMKVMLVITDGNNNAGEYVPLDASDIARGFGMDVYAIGIGTDIEVEQQQVGCCLP